MESGDVPEPLCCDRLNQLILFTGLDIANNPLHSKVFFAFTQKRSADRAPLSIRMLTVNVPIKSKSTTSVKPSKCSKGILKHAWLKKYVDEVPAVMVVFTDLDWDHPSFNEKVTECQSKISSLSFSSRNTRICIVLLQQNCAIGTDDSLSSERAARLCQSCQLPSKQLFVLPITGSIYGYVIRLEAAFHELAQSFYQQRLKQIRARSIPNNFSNLIIRQQFKLAFLSEMRQDTHTALRHYKFAYQQCIDYEHNDNEIYELRYIAGIINYKICYLSFLHGTALEAIAQHSRHVSLFFTASPGIYPSSQLAEIEASMWKSKQCSLFAKLFERAISLGLTAVSTQNPGIYWEAAAVYRIETNQLIEMLDQLIDRHSLTYPEPDPLSPAPVEYIGQRPWRSGVEGGMAADERTETNARIALVLTLKPNHEICLTYLSEARRHYQTHNCARMQRHIMILMATEFSAVGQHGKALQCLSHVLREWHREGFSLSAPTLITKAMIAAFHVANITEFMSMCIQTLNTDAYPSFLSVASHVAANIDLIRRGLPPQAPFPYSSISSDELSVAKELWTRALSERNFFSLEMSRINSFLKARVAFVAPDISVEMGSTFIVMVFLSSHSCISMTFDRLRLSLDEMVATTSSINQNDPAIADRSPLFVFTAENVEVKSNETTQIPFRCILENKKLVDSMKIIVSSLTLELGTVTSTIYGSFEWDWSSLITDQMSVPDADVGAISITASKREAHLKLVGEACGEAMLGEIATLSVTVMCDEQSVSEIRFVVFGENSVEQCDEIPRSIMFLNSDGVLDFQSSQVVAVDESRVVTINIDYCVQAVGLLSFVLKAVVDLKLGTAERCFNIPVRSRQPFNIRTSLFTLNNELIVSPFIATPFFIRADIETTADILISGINWKTDPAVEFDDGGSLQFREGEEKCSKGDVISICAHARIPTETPLEKCHAGHISIQWKRESSCSWVMSHLDAGVLKAQTCPLVISAHVGVSPCVVRNPIPITFRIQNIHDDIIDLQLSLDKSDVFMFSGNKQASIHLLSGDVYECRIAVMALTAGRLSFPKLLIESSCVPLELLEKIIRCSVPKSIFVQPLSKP